ncbi:MAG: hypothetical protein L0287_13890 [Anaerolineae bacterium]|nr:hypothetical protein [Anaerolineae bacterium]
MDNTHPIETQDSPDRWSRFLLAAGVVMVLLIVAAVSAYSWFAVSGPCTVNTVQAASTSLIDQLNLFDSLYQSIPARTPIAIIGPVTEMQQILMDTKEVVVPACLQLARNELITAMETLIRALLAIMESKPEATVTGLVEKSTTHLDNFTAELELINKCAPFCP